MVSSVTLADEGNLASGGDGHPGELKRGRLKETEWALGSTYSLLSLLLAALHMTAFTAELK